MHVASPARPVGQLFGVGAYVAQRGGSETSQIIRRAHFAGAQWVREEFTATEVHTGPTAPYRWGQYDRVVNAERRAGLQVLGLLDYSNTWGHGDHGTVPHADLERVSADYAAYAAAVARHFHGRVQYWEIWNEPNLAIYWHPAPDPADYAVLVDAASRAIKRANPAARVVLGGTSGVDLDFLRAVAQRTDQFDVVAVHPYRSQPEAELMPQVTALLTLGKPVWFSEIGWPAGQGCPCPDENEQANDLVRFYSLSAAAGVQRVFWYDFRDDAQGTDAQEIHFGLVRRDLSAKPAFIAYAFMSHTLAGTDYVGIDRLNADGVYALRFRRGSRPLEILWNAGSDAQEVQLPWSGAEAVLVAEDGTTLDRIPVEDGAITTQLPPDGAPVYILDGKPAYRVPLAATLPLPPAPTSVATPVVGSAHSRRKSRRPARRAISIPTPLARSTLVTAPPEEAATTVLPIPTMATTTPGPLPTATAHTATPPRTPTMVPQPTSLPTMTETATPEPVVPTPATPTATIAITPTPFTPAAAPSPSPTSLTET